METLLLASLLACSDAQWIVEGVVNNNAGMSRIIQLEIITEIREAAPEDCNILMGDSRFPDESTSWRNGVLHPTPFSHMATVTYRGVKYDTDRTQKTITKIVPETYRGIKHAEIVKRSQWTL